MYSYLFLNRKEKAPKKTSGLLVLGKLSDFRLLRLYAFNILATCTVERRCIRVLYLKYSILAITCLGRQRVQIGMLQRLVEMRPYLLCLLPIVQDKLHHSSRGSLMRQPYVAFRRCYDLVEDR